MEYLLFLQDLRGQLGPAVEAFFLAVSSVAMYVPFVLPFFIYWAFDKDRGLFIVTNFALARVVNGVIKVTACVFRPWILDSRIQPSEAALPDATGYSFPSGHVSNTVATFGSLAATSKRTWTRVGCAALIVLVMLSRNYLGVHTLNDVVVGLVSIAVLVFVMYKAWPWLGAHVRDGAKVVGVVLAACAACVAYTLLKGYPASDLVDPIKMQKDTIEAIGGLVGFVVAWYLEPKCIGFATEGLTAKLRAERCAVGVVLVGATYAGEHMLGKVLETRLAAFIGFAAIYLVAMLLVPLVFTKIERALRR